MERFHPQEELLEATLEAGRLTSDLGPTTQVKKHKDDGSEAGMVSAAEFEKEKKSADAAIREGRAIAAEKSSMTSSLRCAEEQVRASGPDDVIILRCFMYMTFFSDSLVAESEMILAPYARSRTQIGRLQATLQDTVSKLTDAESAAASVQLSAEATASQMIAEVSTPYL